MELKDIIKNRRLELNLTMKELAKRVGVSEGTISRWESGHISNMRRDRALSLAKALNIPIETVMGWETKRPMPESTSAIDNITVPEAREIPILGEICAGSGIFCDENYDGVFYIDKSIKADCCLIVSGDSMRDAGIQDRDIAFIKRQDCYKNGDMVAVIIKSENTASLKKICFDGPRAILMPCNPDYSAAVIALDDLAIVGKVIGNYRPMI